MFVMAVAPSRGSAKSAPLIFITPDGDAVKFFIRPSSTKARLRPLIERSGGLVTSRLSGKEDVIRIAADDDIVAADDYVSAKFVDDCLESGQLLDVNSYICKQTGQTKTVAEEGSSHVMENVSISGRMKYTEDDDRNILEYVAKHPSNYAGNAMWKKMELMRITYHSWQSMRDHFLKHLEEKLPEYIALEKEKQQDSLQSGKRDSEDEHNQTKRQKYDEDLENSTPQKKRGDIYAFLKNIKDPKKDYKPEEPSDGIESQIIALIKVWSQKYGLSRKAIALSLHINSGDLDHTEYLLDERTLHPDVRLWSHPDDVLLMKDEKYNALCQKYGENSVRKRKEFLTP